MAMNLRLPDELAAALRALAERTGRSQQDLAREALEEFVRDFEVRAFPAEVRWSLHPPRRAYSRSTPQALPGVEGAQVSESLLEARSERFGDVT